MTSRFPKILALALFLATLSGALRAESIGSVNYRFKWLGPSD